MLGPDDHPLLRFREFETLLPAALGDVESPAWLVALLAADAEALLQRDETVRAAIRDMLRHGGELLGRAGCAVE